MENVVRSSLRTSIRRRQNCIAYATAFVLSFCTLPLAAQNVITLGTSAAFSGAFAEYGEEFRKGADACLAGINTKGGVGGRQIRIEYMDDGYEPARTVQNARELAARGVVAFVNFVGTGGLQALRPVLDELQIPMIGNSSGANQVRDLEVEGSRWVYHSKASYGDEFQGLARIMPTIGLMNVALVYQDNPFGRAGLESARAAFSRPGALVPTVSMGNSVDKIDVAILEVMRIKPHAVVLVAAGTLAPEFIAKYQQAAGAHARVAVLSVVGVRNLNNRLGEKISGIITSMVYPSPWSTSRKMVREYQAAMAYAKQELSLQSLEGCVNLLMTVEAIKAAGKAPTAQGIQQALQRGLKMNLGDFFLHLPAGSQVASRYITLGIFRPNGHIRE